MYKTYTYRVSLLGKSTAENQFQTMYNNLIHVSQNAENM